MKKDKFILICIFAISVILILEWGISFSSIFLMLGMILIYGVRLLRRFKEFKNDKYINGFYNIYKILIILFISSFIIVESLIIISIKETKSADDLEVVDNIIVLGAGLNKDKVSKTLKSRLDKAIEYYNKNDSSEIIVSGGLGKNEVITEAQAMYNYLIENGIDKDKVIKEDKATTTLENIIYSKEILKSKNEENDKVLIVTNDYHIFRAQLIANILDVKNIGLSSKSSLSGRLYYMIREYPTTLIDVVRSIVTK